MSEIDRFKPNLQAYGFGGRRSVLFYLLLHNIIFINQNIYKIYWFLKIFTPYINYSHYPAKFTNSFPFHSYLFTRWGH